MVKIQIFLELCLSMFNRHLEIQVCFYNVLVQNSGIKLKFKRNLSFEEIADIILKNEYIDIIDHPKRNNQSIFVIEINNYIHAVPFIVDKEERIILKTAFPSRKLHKKYRGKK